VKKNHAILPNPQWKFDRFSTFCVVCVITVSLVWLTTRPVKTSSKQDSPSKGSVAIKPPSLAGQKVHALEAAYFREKAKVPEIWWLSDLPLNPEDGAFVQKMLDREKLVKNTLDRFRKVSPLAEQIHAKFGTFAVSVFLRGNASITIGQVSQIKQAGVEICFVAKNEAKLLEKSINAPSSLYWRSDWGMFVNAVEMPYSVFAGLLYHELGHGIRHPVSHAGKGYFKPGSDEYVAEEIEMHALETLVFSEASGGSFGKIIDEILSRNPKALNTTDVLAGITLSDLVRFDISIGADKAGLETSQLLFAHYMIAVGTAHCDLRSAGIQEKILMFRWLHREVFGIPVRM
jgi:hypothetical protein